MSQNTQSAVCHVVRVCNIVKTSCDHFVIALVGYELGRVSFMRGKLDKVVSDWRVVGEWGVRGASAEVGAVNSGEERSRWPVS